MSETISKLNVILTNQMVIMTALQKMNKGTVSSFGNAGLTQAIDITEQVIDAFEEITE